VKTSLRVRAETTWRLLDALARQVVHPHARHETVRAFQARRLRRVVAGAYDRVPYYRRLFDRHGIRPGDIRTPADLPLVPISTKRDLRAEPAGDVVARGIDPDRLITYATSGASGEPFTIRRTWLEERVLGAYRLRALHGFGMRPTDRLVLLGLARAPHPRDHQLLQQLVSAVGLYRRLPTFCLRPPAEVLRAVRDARADVLTGYPGVLSRLADALAHGDGPAPPLRFIVGVGEVLAAPTRRNIQERFGAPVFELYATFEFGLIASECRETGLLHVCDDNVVVEVVRDGQPVKPGERGEIVATSLHASAMPFLRYRLGDVVTSGPERCPCGQPFSTIASVQGRTLDYLTMPGGRLLHAYEIVTRLPLAAGTWIQRYQIVQDRIDRITVRIVPARVPEPDELARVRDAITQVVGRDVDLGVTLVREIEDEPSGKFRVSRSLVTTGVGAAVNTGVTGAADAARCPR
jgi:phenylacetate-CoA ligase